MSPARTVTRRSVAGSRRRTAARPAARRRPVRRPVKRTSKAARQAKKALRPATWWPPLLIVLAVVVGLAWDADEPAATALAPAPSTHCTLAGTGSQLNREQIANARTIAQVAHERGLP